MIPATVKYLKSKNKFYELEKAVLKSLKEILPIKDQEIKLNLLSELKNRIHIIVKDKFEANALVYFNYISWIDSKLKFKNN